MNTEQPNAEVTTREKIIDKIYVIRGQKVMLDKDLAEMYEVAPKVLNQSVKRNSSRFREDFMFQLTEQEVSSLRSQFVTLEKGRGEHTKFLPYAFTEQDVAMLSSVLRSETAIQVNIQMIRVFTKMKQLLLDNKDLLLPMEKIAHVMLQKEDEVKAIFNILKKLLQPDLPPREPVGFPYPNKK